MNGFKGTVFPISPQEKSLLKKPTKRLDVPKSIDLAVIVIKNTLVAPVLENVVKRKSKELSSLLQVSKKLMKKVQNENNK